MGANKLKLKQAIEQGNMEGARIYAQNYTREKNQNLNFLRLSSRIDAVSSRLETAIRMQQINAAMGQTVKGMSNAMKSMQVDQIARTMEQFEKQFEDMDVRSGKQILVVILCCHYAHTFFFSGYMEQAMDNSTAMSTPPEEVDMLIRVRHFIQMKEHLHDCDDIADSL